MIEFLLEMDRRFMGIYRKMNPPMQDVINQLQDQLEEMHLQILDLNESRTVLRDIKEARENQIKQLNQQLDECRKVRLKQSAVVARCTSLEADVRKLEKELDICEKNRQHVFTLHQSKEAMLKEAVKIVEDLREKAKKSDEYKGQAEHLARQAIRLQDELNAKREEHARMMAEFQEIKEMVADLVEENNKFREQTTRLVKESADRECPGIREGRTDALCGGCLGCQLKQAQAILSQTAENFTQANKDRETLHRSLNQVLESHAENQKLVKSLSQELSHAKQIARICRDGLTAVTEASVFARKGVANQALAERVAYIKNANLPWENF